jgi:hypothetical protein
MVLEPPDSPDVAPSDVFLFGCTAYSSPEIAAALPHRQLPIDAVRRLINLQCRTGARKAIS